MTYELVDEVFSGLSRKIVVCLLIVQPAYFVSSVYVMSAEEAHRRPWNAIFRAGAVLEKKKNGNEIWLRVV